MNKEYVEILKQFITAYEQAKDEEVFRHMWKHTLNTPNEPHTLQDAYNEAYGSALIQLYANEADW